MPQYAGMPSVHDCATRLLATVLCADTAGLPVVVKRIGWRGYERGSAVYQLEVQTETGGVHAEGEPEEHPERRCATAAKMPPTAIEPRQGKRQEGCYLLVVGDVHRIKDKRDPEQ